MPAMEWSERYELGLTQMDATHKEFVEQYNRLAGATAENFLAQLDAFIAHTEAHFDQENRWMEAVNFPGCHRAEHDRVLAVMRDVRERLVRGDVVLGRRLVEELPPWFDNHAASMDAALAYHLDAVGYDVASGQLREPKEGCGADQTAGCACATLSASPDEAPAS